MKALLTISRIIVGVLFIFSGLIKANDPLGLSYKMQEFFEVWGMHFLNDYTLAFALLMNGFEIVAGVAVLIGWRMRMFSWLLLWLIVFFTFLTGYALFSGKIKTCGCFGDCIPLTPTHSFIKDLVLLVLILFIFIYRNKIRPLFANYINGAIISIAVLFCVVSQWYVLEHLPFIDCLPYKKGNNIVEQMKIPEGAVADSFAINFIYKKDGKQVKFDMNNFPDDFNDSTYEFIGRDQKLVRPASASAAISDFSISSLTGNDTTLAILSQPNVYVLLFLKDVSSVESNWSENAKQVIQQCREKNIPFFVVSATAEDAQQALQEPNVTFLRCDATVIKTAARVNPTYFVMQQANVLAKFANTDYDDVLKKLDEAGKK
ncbi:MAG: DoxX family protein [Segetibacter sp.]|nr:DoxX family protein [Segetibacter sp.]